MSDTIADAEADRALKARHSAMWSLGDYPAVTRDLITEFGPLLVDATGIRQGHRVLDVAAGTGNVAIRAAQAGADVIASDLTPALVDEGRRLTEEAGADLRWEVADAEHLPYDDAVFDVVTSSVGVMFAPHHQQAADELIRVCRPGGTIGLISWTPEGFIGQMFAAMKPFAPPPPPGARPPPLWGSRAHLEELFGDRVSSLETEVRGVRIRFASGEEFLDYFKDKYGPTIAVYRSLAGDPERTAELDRVLADLGDGFVSDDTMTWDYLLAVARRAES